MYTWTHSVSQHWWQFAHYKMIFTSVTCLYKVCSIYFSCICFRCIDGYYRKIMWLWVSCSNHDPGLIANYFLETVSHVGGYPAHVRTDCGTENVTIAAIQSFVTGSTALRYFSGESTNSHGGPFFRRYKSHGGWNFLKIWLNLVFSTTVMSWRRNA